MCSSDLIGVAESGPHCHSAAELLRHADTAMYAAKRDKARGWHRYEPAPGLT